MTGEFVILDGIQKMRTAFGDFFFPLIGHLADGGAICIIAAIILLIFPKKRKVGLAVAIALILDVLICNALIKPLVNRVRPCDINTAVELLIKRPHDASFPSGHSAAMFAMTSAMFFSKDKLWIPSFILSCLVAFARMYVYVHFPTDILAGIVIGTLLGALGAYLGKLIMQRAKDRADEKKQIN